MDELDATTALAGVEQRFSRSSLTSAYATRLSGLAAISARPDRRCRVSSLRRGGIECRIVHDVGRIVGRIGMAAREVYGVVHGGGG